MTILTYPGEIHTQIADLMDEEKQPVKKIEITLFTENTLDDELLQVLVSKGVKYLSPVK